MAPSPRPRPELCVGAVAIVDERLLLVQRGQAPGFGLWSLPGGRVERGETMAEAVVREVDEETGLAVVCDQLIGWVERLDDQHHFVIMDFAVTPLGGTDVVAATDALDARWVPLSDVSGLPLVDGLLDFLADHHIVTTL